MKFNGFIFDFNGVLWWDNDLQEQAWQQFAKKLAGRTLTSQEMDIYVHGRPNSDTITYLLGHKPDVAELAKMNQEKEDIYRGFCLAEGENFKLSPGAVALLDFLRSNNISHTIATSSLAGNVQFFFEHLGLAKWFDLQKVACDDGTMPGKPAPDIYLKAASNIGLSPEQCVVVEDAISGLQSASAAGIGWLIALGPKEKHLGLSQQPGVKQVVINLGEINKEQLFF